MKTRRSRRTRPHTVSGDRIELLCHTINEVANNLPWYVSWQEFHWSVEIALQDSGLPKSWIQAASTPEMTAEYQKSFRAKGYCLKPNDLHETLQLLKVH